jgi:hypothetical protein
VKCDGRWEKRVDENQFTSRVDTKCGESREVTSEQLSCVNSPRKVGGSSLFVDCRAKPAVEKPGGQIGCERKSILRQSLNLLLKSCVAVVC